MISLIAPSPTYRDLFVVYGNFRAYALISTNLSRRLQGNKDVCLYLEGSDECE